MPGWSRACSSRAAYVDLAFPIATHPGGPPFAVAGPEILALFTSRGLSLQLRETPVDSVAQRRGQEELFIFQKAAGPTSPPAAGS